jgi:hypothetical protein
MTYRTLMEFQRSSDMDIRDSESFFKACPNEMYYVGFFKSPQAWFPLSFVSDPENGDKLDSLFLSTSYPTMMELVKGYAEKIPQIEQTSVQYLLREEIQNLLQIYELKHIGLAVPAEGASGCGCGCGCGCG